ncbi:MAG: hypothetical protein DLD55_02525 [candidate division SR1 bacterium]|nr:MAG: hypothetical protein DLD55_02525 [candidate division SR1 bacterium]
MPTPVNTIHQTEEKNLITPLRALLSSDQKTQLTQAIEYGNLLRQQGEVAKKTFWTKQNSDQFLAQLMNYDKLRNTYLTERKLELQQLGYFDWSETKQAKFDQEFLRNILLYTQLVDQQKIKKVTKEEVDKRGFRNGETLNLRRNKIGDDGVQALAKKRKLKEGVSLDLGGNKIGDEGAKALAEHWELKEGVSLDLQGNKIGDAGAKALAEHWELKDGVSLDLRRNKIGADGVQALVEHWELKEGVSLNLRVNKIGDAGAKALVEHWELKDGVSLSLVGNNIGDEGEKVLQQRVDDARARGINCKVEW